MRHRVVGRKLKRTASHRRALMRSLSTELIRHKRITTTEAKAREAGRFVETLITKAKRAYLAEQGGGDVNIHARRLVGKYIQDKTILRELFTEVASKVADRPGGYTRIVKIGRRNGDGAELAVLELVDYNTDRDEGAVRSRSKKLMTRAERVRRSQEQQKKTEEKESEAVESEVDVPEVEDVAGDPDIADATAAGANVSDEVATEESPVQDIEQVTEGAVAEEQKLPPEGADTEDRADNEATSDDSGSDDNA